MVSRTQKALDKMRNNPAGIEFSDLKRVCDEFFGPARNRGTSHYTYKTPWVGDPRVNIQQGKNGQAKEYQVKQVLAAIDRLAEVSE